MSIKKYSYFINENIKKWSNHKNKGFKNYMKKI